MKSSAVVINIQETIGKSVGRRRPVDPMRIADSNKERAKQWQKVFPSFMPRKGVARFKSHTDADEWLKTNSLRNQPQT